jgi:hypothetical protein
MIDVILPIDGALIVGADGALPTVTLRSGFREAGWQRVESPLGPGALWLMHRSRGLAAGLTAGRHGGDTWVHLSVSHRQRVPGWDELVFAKESILGEETKAVQVLAPRSQWVNICDKCLHLFVNTSRDPLPDFTEGTGSL